MFDCIGEDEIDIVLFGIWLEYLVVVNWCEDLEVVYVVVEIDIKILDVKWGVLFEFFILINE